MTPRIFLLCLAGIIACAEQPLQTLSSWTPEAPGDNCANGGLRLQMGVDKDRDGVLGESEALETQYVCRGVLTKTGVEAAGDNCERGGYRFDYGADVDGDGVLADAEITSTEYLCEGNVLLRKQYLGAANDDCHGGYVLVEYGFDADGDGALSDTEVSSSFTSCNQVPRIEKMPARSVSSCEEPIVLTAGVTDLDGSIASYAWEVRSSASELVLSGADTATVRLAAGAHLGGATLRLTATDDLGATSWQHFTLVFTGTGCQKHETFYGVDPSSCTAIDVTDLAGDDRGGTVVSERFVYYNGDDALVRTDLDLNGLQSIGPEDVDTLFVDAASGVLFSLWRPDLGETPLSDLENGALSAYAETGYGQIVPIDEDTLAPGTPITLAKGIFRGTQAVQYEEGQVSRTTYDNLIAARDGRLVVASYNRDTRGRQRIYNLQFRVFSLVTGELLSNVVIDRPADGEERLLWERKRFTIQEARFMPYAMVASGEAGDRLVYRNPANEWVEYNVTHDEVTVRSSSFASSCDVHNLSLNPTNTVAYFHDEGACFSDLESEETLIRCDVLFGDNSEGTINDSGN